MLDIDNFKHYNDTYGHQAGDAVIRAVAEALGEVFSRSDDVVVRYGGEEFLLCISLDTADTAAELAEEVHRSIHVAGTTTMLNQQRAPVTVSIGYTCVQSGRRSGLNLNQLIAEADKALYQAKARGKNCTVRFTDRGFDKPLL